MPCCKVADRFVQIETQIALAARTWSCWEFWKKLPPVYPQCSQTIADSTPFWQVTDRLNLIDMMHKKGLQQLKWCQLVELWKKSWVCFVLNPQQHPIADSFVSQVPIRCFFQHSTSWYSLSAAAKSVCLCAGSLSVRLVRNTNNLQWWGLQKSLCPLKKKITSWYSYCRCKAVSLSAQSLCNLWERQTISNFGITKTLGPSRKLFFLLQLQNLCDYVPKILPCPCH
jgi:hypothetical protein